MEEIDMETLVERIRRIRPFCNHQRTRIFLLKQFAYLSPEEFRCVLVGSEELFITASPSSLDQSSSHVGTEAVATHIHPETKHILQIILHSHNVRMIGWQLPLLLWIRIGKAEVQRRLTPVEISCTDHYVRHIP